MYFNSSIQSQNDGDQRAIDSHDFDDIHQMCISYQFQQANYTRLESELNTHISNEDMVVSPIYSEWLNIHLPNANRTSHDSEAIELILDLTNGICSQVGVNTYSCS